MAAFLGRDPSQARSLLAGVGVRILRIDDPDRDAVLGEVLGDATDERGRIVAEPPADEAAAATGMGAWHRNSVNEFHTVLDGRGIVEFVTADGPVSVLLTSGDIMAVERAEHRYRPLSPQGWVLRFGGPADGGLESTDTGRAAARWPDPAN
jgi:mannose-6-phosphate isomerase-like protein (cupin superfamily)